MAMKIVTSNGQTVQSFEEWKNGGKSSGGGQQASSYSGPQIVNSNGQTVQSFEEWRQNRTSGVTPGGDSAIMDWIDRYNRVMQGVSIYDRKRNGGFTQDASGGFGSEIESLIADYDGIEGYASEYGFRDAQKYLVQLKKLQNSIGQINDSFSQFEDEDAYTQYMEAWKDHEKKKNLDPEAYEREIKLLENALNEYRNLSRWNQDSRGTARMEAIRQQYGSLDEMEALLSQKQQYLTEAKQLQEMDALSATANKDEEEKKNLDLDAYSREIAVLEQQLEDYDPQIDWTNPTERKQYDAGLKELQDEINRRKQYLNQATRLQKKDDLSAVADPGSEKYDTAFESKTGYVSTELDGKLQRMLSKYGMGYEDLTYEYINNHNGIRDDIKRNARAYGKDETPYETEGYDYMHEDEVALYNYYYSMGGKASAEAYLDTIRKDLHQRKAAGMFQPMEGKTALEMLYGVEAGLDQFKSGIKGFYRSVAGDDSYVAPSARQYASGMVRQDLEDNGVMLPSWMGGASLGQMGYDVITTTTNMAPSILASAGANLVLPGSGAIIGSALMGGSAAGNAFQEKINEGYSVELARKYGAAIGISETVLSYLLGGISDLGGIASNHAIRNALQGVEKGLSKAIIQIGGHVGFEALEEGLQEILAPIFSNMILNTDESIDWGQVVYSAILGGFTGGLFEGSRAAINRTFVSRNNATPEPDNETALPDNETALPDNATALPDNETALPDNETALPDNATAEEENTAAHAQKTAVTAKMTSGEGSQDVTIAEILSMDDNDITFRLEDGRTVTYDDLDFENGQQVLSAVRDLGLNPETANTILREISETSASDAAIADGIYEAHRYGTSGYSMEQLTKYGSNAAVLTDGQRNAVWEAGRQIHLQKAEAAPVRAAKVPERAGVWFDNGGGNVIAFDEYNVRGLPKAAVVGARAAQALHKLGIGRNYYFFESYENEAGERVYKDENGVERKAPNGWYDPDGSIHIDLKAGGNANGLTLYTLAHELTHHIENVSKAQYQALADFLVANYAKGGNVDAMVAAKQAELNASRGKGQEVTYEKAYSEFIADSMEAMLGDGNVLQKLQELKQTDRSLFDRIKAFFDDLVKKIRDVYKDLTPDSAEGQAVLEMKDQIEQIQQLFAQALVDASEHYAASEEIGLSVDAETDSVAPAVQYSERTWKESDYVQERNKAAQEISKAIGVSVKKARQYIDSVNGIAKMIAEDRTRLDYFSSPGRSSFIGNVEYGGSFDFSTLCKKRRLLTGTFTAIQKALPNTALTANEILDIRNRMKDAGLEVSCGLCYVEGSRANMGQFAKEFLRLYKQYYPDAWQPNMADVNTPDGIEWVRINHPECYEQYEYFWNHYGTLKAGDKNLFASQQKPKLYQLHTEYKGEILQKFKGDDNVEEKNLNGGIRLQSFSDFEIVHLIDTMQIIMDMSRVGLAGQAYTKVPDFAWALGDTGLKINLSLIAKGVDESGKLIFDDIEGMPIAEAMKLRDRYSANVGTILVAFNDAQLMAAMADDRVDFIIPFHRSQWKKSQYEAMGLPAKTKDYTFMQNEKFIKPQYHEYRGRMVKDKATNYMPNEYWDFSKTGKENAEAYLQMCARNNKRPKFYKLLQNNGDGSYSLKADGSTDGYWKLLIDFKMYDNDGIGSPQMPVRPDFNMEESARMMREYKGDHSSFPVAQGIVDAFVQEYKQEHPGRQFSDRKKPGEYSGIREVLAKKGLDELSVKLGDQFPLSAKFDETMRNDGTELVMENVAANSVVKGRKESAYKVGRKAFTSKYGVKTRVHIAQMGIDADLYADVANESINKAIGNPDEQSTLDVIPHIDKILSNSVLMGVERIAHTDKKGTALFGYRLYNLYWYVDGNKKTPHALVCTVVQDLNKAEGYVFKNIENVTIGRGLPGINAGMSSPVNGDTYTVAQLYDAVKRIDRNDGGLKYSADDRNTYLFSYTEREDGVAYQDRSTGTSNRALLAGAFEELVTSPEELQFLREYQENVAHLNEQEAKLQDIRTEIREISFGKGPRDTKRLQQLQDEATKTANRIDIYDKKLLKLERAKPLRDVLDREREKVRKATRQKGREALDNYRENRKESAARKDARRKIRKKVMELDKLLNRGDKKKNVKNGMNAMVSSSLKLADALFMDEYSNRDILRNGFSTPLTDAEEAAFRDAQQLLQSIENGAALEDMEFSGEMDAQNYLRKLDGRLNGKMATLKDAFARERKQLYGTTVSDLLGKLADEYSRLSEAEDGAVRAAKDENVYAHLLQLQQAVGGTTVRDMSLSQLEQVADAYTMVLTTVRNANKMFAKNLQFKRDTLAGMVIGEIGTAAENISKLVRPGKDAADRFSWNNLKPVYAFERLGSQTLKTLFGNIRKGQDVWAVDMREADAFRSEQYRKHNRKEWNLEKQFHFEFESGKVDLNLEQIMSLYAYSRREAALDHLLKGGFVFSGSTEVLVKENGIQRRYLKKDATAYNLSESELSQVIDTLSDEQKAFVEEMQTYLSDVMGGKGNEVSLQMYGIKSFGETNYFPIRSAGQYLENAKEDNFRREQGQISIVNSGFTKATTPHASNPITLDGFMNIWSEHVNDMSMYHGFALPMEDFRRVYNYSTPNMEESNSKSVNAAIENAHGRAATAYIDQLYKDLNGGAVIDSRESTAKRLISLHKKASVLASFSVTIQQPSAFVRAFALIDPRYFIGPKIDRKQHKQLWEELKTYAPVAIVKEMGYFDTGMGRSGKDYLQTEEYSGIREKAAAIFKDGDYRDEVLGRLPALADEIAWCGIWNAVKRETKSRNPGMDVRSDAFLKIAGERFGEVIDKTQVYDSVLSRSANMRSKSNLMNMATAFMAEPTTSINMLEDALRKNDKKQLKRTVGAVYGSVLLNSLLVSLVYAARDDDDDETWWEKYLSTLAVEMVDGINPITYYPFLRDVWSIGQGFDVERADMTLITDLTNAARKMVQSIQKVRQAEEGKEDAAIGELKDSLWRVTDSVASLVGLPVKNIRRDINGAVNIFRTISRDLAGRKTTGLSLQDSVLADVMASIPIGNLLYSRNKREQLYNAMIAGDTAYVQRLKAGYESDDAYHSAIKQALRDHDSRIWEAAVAWNANDMETYIRIAKEIRNENHFAQDDIVLAIRAEASAMAEKENSSTDKAYGYFTNEKFGVALGQNNTSMADVIRQDLIDTALANGKTRDEAEEAVRSAARTQLKKLYADGTIAGANAEKMLVKYGGYDRETASGKVAEWQFEKNHPELDGRITYTQYKRWEADGKSRGVALETFTDVAEYQDSGTSGSNRSQAEVADYINRLPITTAQKDALWCCFWKESTLYKNAPWH